jgi:hypothetical protein
MDNMQAQQWLPAYLYASLRGRCKRYPIDAVEFTGSLELTNDEGNWLIVGHVRAPFQDSIGRDEYIVVVYTGRNSDGNDSYVVDTTDSEASDTARGIIENIERYLKIVGNGEIPLSDIVVNMLQRDKVLLMRAFESAASELCKFGDDSDGLGGPESFKPGQLVPWVAEKPEQYIEGELLWFSYEAQYEPSAIIQTDTGYAHIIGKTIVRPRNCIVSYIVRVTCFAVADENPETENCYRIALVQKQV